MQRSHGSRTLGPFPISFELSCIKGRITNVQNKSKRILNGYWEGRCSEVRVCHTVHQKTCLLRKQRWLTWLTGWQRPPSWKHPPKTVKSSLLLSHSHLSTIRDQYQPERFSIAMLARLQGQSVTWRLSILSNWTSNAVINCQISSAVQTTNFPKHLDQEEVMDITIG